MQLRNTLVMALILVVLGAFVYFYEIRGHEERQEAERAAKRLMSFEVADVERLVLDGDDGPVTAVRDEDGEWRIVEPVATAADGTALDSLVQSLSNAQHERLVTEEPESLEAFGLAEPRVRATVHLKDGGSQTLEVGRNTPVGANVYVKRDDEPTVYIALGSAASSLEKDLYDLRDKNVLRFADGAAKALELDRDGLAARLRRDEDGDAWNLVEPIEGTADADAVEELLRRLRTDRAAGFVADGVAAEQLSEYGLAEPAMRIAVTTEDDARHELVVGDESDEPGGYYARRGGADTVFVVPRGLVDAVPPDLETLRNKSVVDVPRGRIDRIAVAGSDGHVALEKAGTEWSIVAPRRIAADASAVSLLITDLLDLRAAAFAEDRVDVPSPDTTITLRLSPPQDGNGGEGGTEAETVTIRVGGDTTVAGDEDDGADEPVPARYVASSAAPTVFIVPAEDLEGLSTSLFELRAKTLVEFRQSDVDRLEVDHDGATRVLRRDGDTWTVETTGTAGSDTVEDDVVSDVLWDLNYLRMQGVAVEWGAGEEAPDLAAFGLAAPAYRVRVFVGDDQVADVSVGDPVPAAALPEDVEPGERYYARVDERPGVFEIARGLPDALRDAIAALAAG